MRGGQEVARLLQLLLLGASPTWPLASASASASATAPGTSAPGTPVPASAGLAELSMRSAIPLAAFALPGAGSNHAVRTLSATGSLGRLQVRAGGEHPCARRELSLMPGGSPLLLLPAGRPPDPLPLALHQWVSRASGLAHRLRVPCGSRLQSGWQGDCRPECHWQCVCAPQLPFDDDDAHARSVCTSASPPCRPACICGTRGTLPVARAIRAGVAGLNGGFFPRRRY